MEKTIIPRKIVLCLCLCLSMLLAHAQDNLWMIFAPGPDQGATKTVNFANNGKLYFNQDGMTYSDANQEVSIPYAGASYIYFGNASYNLGDVNGDGRITPVDIALTVSKVLGGTPANFIFAAADMNGDGRITPVDIARIVSIILCGGNKAPSRAVVYTPEIPACGETSSITLAGDGVVTVSLSGIDRFTAMLMDIELPDGVDIDKLSLSAGNDHIVQHSRLDNGMCRILVYSLNNDALTVDAELTITLSGANSGTIAIDNILVTECIGTDEFEEYVVTGCSQQVSALDFVAANTLNVQPTNDGLTINAPCDMTVVVADMLGRVRQYDLHAGINHISLARGIYLVNNHKVIIK